MRNALTAAVKTQRTSAAQNRTNNEHRPNNEQAESNNEESAGVTDDVPTALNAKWASAAKRNSSNEGEHNNAHNDSTDEESFSIQERSRRKRKKKKHKGRKNTTDEVEDTIEVEDSNDDGGNQHDDEPQQDKATEEENGAVSGVTDQMIAKNEYVPDEKLTMAYVEMILGDKVRRMSAQEKRDYMAQTEDLKEKCSRYMRNWVCRKVLEIAERDITLRDRTIRGLQKYWGALSEEKKGSLKMKKASQGFWNATQGGATEFLPRDWEFKAEREYMTKHNLTYKKDGTKLDGMKGCIAKHATHSLRTVRRRIFHESKKNGGIILSSRVTGIPGTGRNPKQTRRKDHKFHSKYLRKVTRVKVQLNKKGDETQSDVDEEDEDVEDDIDMEEDEKLSGTIDKRKKEKEVSQFHYRHFD